MRRPTVLYLAVLTYSMGATAAFAQPNPFTEFQQLASRTCADHNLDYLLDGDWHEIILEGKGPAFSPLAEKRLDRSRRHFVRALRCAESISVDCYVTADLLATQSQGFMKEFVRQICRTWQCEEEAICNYEAKAPQIGK